MSLVETAAAVVLDLGAVALLGWTTWTAVQFRDRPSARPFIAVLATLTLWAVFALGAETTGAIGHTPVSGVSELGQFGVALLFPGVVTVYALSFTGRGTGLTRWRIAMLAGIILPAVVGGIVLATDPPTAVAEQVFASLFGTEILYLAGLSLYSIYLLVGLARRHARVTGMQVAILIGGIAAPYLAGTMERSGSAADGVTVGLLASGGLLAVAVRRYPVMTGFPKADHVARTRVVEALQEGVFVLDWDDHVLDANATTGDRFDRSPGAMVGEPIQSIVDGIEGRDLSVGTTGRVSLQTTDGRRQFQYSVSAVDGTGTDGEGEPAPVARAVLFRDVTDQQTREQRLAVLNRVLRHNVRNELDVVLAHAERIDDEDLRDGIRESTRALLEISDRAREAEEIMTATAESPEEVDLVSVATSVAEEYRAGDHDGEIELTCPDELVLSSHPTVVRQVLSELVDNALAHADGSPRVEISARESDGATAELAVADNGPGIPERERRILAEGEETDLEHGRGVGLWFVNWAVVQLGGDLEFRERDGGGNVVTVRLHGTYGS